MRYYVLEHMIILITQIIIYTILIILARIKKFYLIRIVRIEITILIYNYGGMRSGF